MTTGVTWDDIARFREVWPRALVLKGIQHPVDAERAVALGVDGIWVSNHGGRQFDAAPASIDTVPAIAAAVGGRAKILYDGSIRSGLDVLRDPGGGGGFLLRRAGLPAIRSRRIGEAGGGHATAAFMEEIRGTFGQAGIAQRGGGRGGDGAAPECGAVRAGRQCGRRGSAAAAGG